MKTSFNLRHGAFASVVLVFGLVSMPEAFAQEGGVLEEIVVTATKRVEGVQDIPLSVQAISGQRLENLGITDMVDLSAAVPNFSVADGLSTNLIIMRGMGSGEDRGFEQSVSLFRDGVYMPRNRQYRNPFFDAERVEVLRGPQAVLFGLNSTAGAVSVVSAANRPGDGLEGKLGVEYESEYDSYRVTGVLGGSPSDNLGVRLAVQSSDTGGWYTNTSTGRDVGAADTLLARLSLIWEPSDNTTITAKYDYVDHDVIGNTAEIINLLAPAIEPGDGVINFTQSAQGDLLPIISAVTPFDTAAEGYDQDASTFSLNIDQQIGEGTLTALLAYSEYTYEQSAEVDSTAGVGFGIPGVAADATTFDDYEQTSAELRWTSPVGGTFETIAGLYYQDSDWLLDASNGILFPGFLLGGLPDTIERGNNPMRVEETLISAFVSATWNLSDRARLIGGLRYSDTSKDFERFGQICEWSWDGGQTWFAPLADLGACAAATEQTGTVDNDELMPELMIQVDLTEDVMGYARYGQSAKAGGISHGQGVSDANQIFGPESVDTYELGLKSQLANGAAELNLALFRSDFEDLQVKAAVVEGTTVIIVVSNAAKSVTQGFELEGRWAANDWLLLGGSVAWLDAEYDDFTNGPCAPGAGTAPCDLSGMKMPYAADLTGNIYADITVPLSNSVNFIAGLDLSYSDDYFTEATLYDAVKQDSWTRYGARIGVEDSEGQWNVAIIGKNLGDEKIITTSQPISGVYDIVYPMMPRTITLQANYHFGN